MNETGAITCIAKLGAAWPWAELGDDTVELWIVALSPYEVEHAQEAIERAHRELERPPSLAWFHDAVRAERDRHAVTVPALPPAVVSPERGRQLAAEARAVLARARSKETAA